MRVAVILTARPSWAKLEPVCRALKAMPEIDLQIICCASALLERYGKVVEVVRKDYDVAAEVYSTLEGANLPTSGKETGVLLQALVDVLSSLRPDCGVVCADRHEVLGAAQACSYLHIPLIHMQGGEFSGSIDDKVRDAITQLADVHCTATERAKHRVYALTGDFERVHWTGCPSVDLAKQAQGEPPVTVGELGGAGAAIDLTQPFAVVLQHPVTNEYDEAFRQMSSTLSAANVCDSQPQLLVMWPGEDAGADAMSKAIRTHPAFEDFHTVRSLPPSRFLKLMTQASVVIGNSSAGIREASWLGVPVVNVGTRQHGRERAGNVVDVSYDPAAIERAIERQIGHGPYPSSALYGSGNAGQRIAEVIRGL